MTPNVPTDEAPCPMYRQDFNIIRVTLFFNLRFSLFFSFFFSRWCSCCCFFSFFSPFDLFSLPQMLPSLTASSSLRLEYLKNLLFSCKRYDVSNGLRLPRQTFLTRTLRPFHVLSTARSVKVSISLRKSNCFVLRYLQLAVSFFLPPSSPLPFLSLPLSFFLYQITMEK